MPRTPKKPANPAIGLTRLMYERYNRELQRFLLRRSNPDRQSAQDLAQEVYLRLLRIEDEALLRNPQGYMYRVASHVVYESLLKAEADPVTFNSDMLETADERIVPAADSGQLRAEVHEQLKTVLRQLPPIQRKVVLLIKRDGLTYKEVARQLGVSTHTVKKYLFRALATLRASRMEEDR